jgi:hypothetical protein
MSESKLRKLAELLGLLLLSSFAAASDGAGTPSPIPNSAKQLLLVRTADWNAVNGTLQRFERGAKESRWHAIGQPITIVVGRTGLAWGLGLNQPPSPTQNVTEPVKIEGDGKAPAGVFHLNTAFGYAPVAEMPSSRWPYLQVQTPDKCVDDTASRYYNTLVSTDQVAPDWHSAEDLHRNDNLYRLGIVVEHNWGDRRQPGKGSCIFLHIWAAANRGTDGCTAMPAPAISEVVAWLDPKSQPVLVQLPARRYEQLRQSWRLP